MYELGVIVDGKLGLFAPPFLWRGRTWVCGLEKVRKDIQYQKYIDHIPVVMIVDSWWGGYVF